MNSGNQDTSATVFASLAPSEQMTHVTSHYRVEVNSFNEDSSATEDSSEDIIEISGNMNYNY